MEQHRIHVEGKPWVGQWKSTHTHEAMIFLRRNPAMFDIIDIVVACTDC